MNVKAARRGFLIVMVLAVLTILLFPIVYADWHSTSISASIPPHPEFSFCEKNIQ